MSSQATERAFELPANQAGRLAIQHPCRAEQGTDVVSRTDICFHRSHPVEAMGRDGRAARQQFAPPAAEYCQSLITAAVKIDVCNWQSKLEVI